jgi:hypothetical protein
MPEWAWQLLMQAWPYSLSLGLGLWLGWWWGLSTPPAVNPWEGRACRDWDGGERWT